MSNGFVFVPNVAGVPPVNFAPISALAAAVGTISQLFVDTASQFSSVFSPQWGIFLDGIPVVTAESVVGFEFRNDWTVSDFPVEGGTFQSYDKVLLPFLAKVRFSAGSTAAARGNLLESIAFAAANVPGPQPIYTIITPEFIYLQAVISHYDYRRTAENGVGLIVVDVWCTQVIPAVENNLSANTVQNPASAAPVNGGSVQTQDTNTGTGAGGSGGSGNGPGSTGSSTGNIPHITVTPSEIN